MKPGTVMVDGEVTIGRYMNGPASGAATGTVNIQNGNLTGNDTDKTVVVGGSAFGTGIGILSVGGNLSGFGQVNIGRTTGTGNADGDGTIGGTYNTDGLPIGITNFSGTVDGFLQTGGKLRSNFVDVDVSDAASTVTGMGVGVLNVQSDGIQGGAPGRHRVGRTIGPWRFPPAADAVIGNEVPAAV